jgi:hypothetical protein
MDVDRVQGVSYAEIEGWILLLLRGRELESTRTAHKLSIGPKVYALYRLWVVRRLESTVSQIGETGFR